MADGSSSRGGLLLPGLLLAASLVLLLAGSGVVGVIGLLWLDASLNTPPGGDCAGAEVAAALFMGMGGLVALCGLGLAIAAAVVFWSARPCPRGGERNHERAS